MPAWHRVTELEKLELETPFALRVGAEQVCVVRMPDGLFALNDVCTHEYALLSDGYFEDGKLECPLHQACFEVRTGKALNEPASVDVVTYPTKVEDGVVFVEV
jgi:3-phenylpropionate/trans-cinnamate dioxygenase ferredoxin subunit